MSYAKHLQHLGYTAIALPSSAFQPLTLMYERGGKRGWNNDFERLVQNPTLAQPPVKAPVAFPTLTGETVRNLKPILSINVLSGLIAALGGGTLKLTGGLERASTITFEYGEVTMTEVSEVALDGHLRSGTPPDRTTLLHRYLSDHLYVATRVLRARSFSVSAEASNGASIGLDVPVISGAVGAGVSVEAKTSNSTKIEFSGDAPAAFAFQAFLIDLVKVSSGLNGMRLLPVAAGTVRTTKVGIGEDKPAFDIGTCDAGVDDSILDREASQSFEPIVIEAEDGGLVLDPSMPAEPEPVEATPA